MKTNNKVIVGAGLSGLIAANVFSDMEIFEASPEPTESHKAVLRFRTPEVGRLVGVDFKPVTVNKGIWCIKRHEFIQPSIRTANQYSMKVSGGLYDRSIWNTDQSTRYVAPENFYQMLVEKVKHRISWGHQLFELPSRGSISTIPMPSIASIALKEEDYRPIFDFADITVRRFKIHNSNVYQTVYIPHPDTSCYRVSITGDLLIAEYIGASDDFDFTEPFGFGWKSVSIEETKSKQKYGKIAPIDNAWRRAFMHRLTIDNGIYSLGRFATWRNILLDDIIKDISVIKEMMKQDSYGLMRSFVK